MPLFWNYPSLTLSGVAGSYKTSQNSVCSPLFLNLSERYTDVTLHAIMQHLIHRGRNNIKYAYISETWRESMSQPFNLSGISSKERFFISWLLFNACPICSKDWVWETILAERMDVRILNYFKNMWSKEVRSQDTWGQWPQGMKFPAPQTTDM